MAAAPRAVRLVHVPKTGGTAIQQFLRRKRQGVRSEDFATWRRLPRVGNVSAAFPHCKPYHVPPGWLAPNPYRLPGHHTVCVVRHPAERLLSEFRMKAPDVATLPLARNFLAFFLRDALDSAERGAAGPNCHYLPQFMYVRGPDQRRTCDHVLRYENLSLAFTRLMESMAVIRRRSGRRKGALLLQRTVRPGRAGGGGASWVRRWRAKQASDPTLEGPSRTHATGAGVLSQLDIDSIPPQLRARIHRVYFEDYCRFGYSP